MRFLQFFHTNKTAKHIVQRLEMKIMTNCEQRNANDNLKQFSINFNE